MKKKTNVIMPNFNLEFIDYEKRNNIIKEKFNGNYQDLEMFMGKLEKISKKNNGLDNDTYNTLVDYNLVTKFSTEEIFNDAINIGREISDCIIEVEEKYCIHPMGEFHLEQILDSYQDKIFTTRLLSKYDNLFAKKYNYSVLMEYGDNEKEFYIFIYKIYEILSLFNTYKEFETTNNVIFDRYYSKENEMEIFTRFIDKYKDFDSVKFYLIKNLQSDLKEFFDLSICTDNFFTPLIFELKNSIASLKTNYKYAMCENCHNIFRQKRKQKPVYCYDKNCRKERDRLRKSKKTNN